MFGSLLTYLQVPHHFLDFVFTFGERVHPLDSSPADCCPISNLDENYLHSDIPQLGRSGLISQLNFSLKGVEPSKGTVTWPWSIRQTSVHHSFDIENGRTFWIFVKGSALISNRSRSQIRKSEGNYPDTYSNTFSLSLENHLILCDWVNEHWRWYINYIDEELHGISRTPLVAQVDPRQPNLREKKPTRMATWLSEKSQQSQSSQETMSLAQRARKVFCATIGPLEDGRFSKDQQPHVRESTRLPNFENIQRMQFIEENANTAKLVLSSNLEVLRAIKDHVNSIWDARAFPQQAKRNCENRHHNFNGLLDNTMRCMSMQLTRVDAILNLLAGRRSLVCAGYRRSATPWTNQDVQQNDMITYCSIRASLTSSKEIEDMTAVSFRIAAKTENKTVTMKLLAVVTLFFLPMTFISVSPYDCVFDRCEDIELTPGSRRS